MKKSTKKAWVRWAQILFWIVMFAGAVLVTLVPPPRHKPPEVATVRVEQPSYNENVAPETPPHAPSHLPAPSLPHIKNGETLIAIVIDDMGLDIRDSRRAINLPPYITLSFLPYATRLKEQTREARDNGHELMLHMPMEPVGRADPGPGALLTELPIDEIRERFQIALASFVGFDGVNNHMGSKFTASQKDMEPVMEELKERDLFFLDSRTSSKSIGDALAREKGVPSIARDVFLDDDMSPKAVRAQLAQLERVAKRKGYAVAIGHPHPATLDALETWLPDAEARGFKFVRLGQLLGNKSNLAD